MHPSYSPRTLFADHALIEVDKPFQLNSRVTLACLPKDGYRIPHGTQNCYIAGNGICNLFVALHISLFPGKMNTRKMQMIFTNPRIF